MRKLVPVLMFCVMFLVGISAYAAARTVKVGAYKISMLRTYDSGMLVALDRELAPEILNMCPGSVSKISFWIPASSKDKIAVLTAAFLTNRHVGFGLNNNCHTVFGKNYPNVYRVDVGPKQ